jgi:hypothetical protein
VEEQEASNQLKQVSASSSKSEAISTAQEDVATATGRSHRPSPEKSFGVTPSVYAGAGPDPIAVSIEKFVGVGFLEGNRRRNGCRCRFFLKIFKFYFFL